MTEHSHVIVAGLHRSGTSLLTRALAEHPEASTFAGTGFPEDEGQFLQRVFPVSKIYGGPGRFGFDRRSHLTERSELLTDANRIRLRSEWERHWDLSKRVLIEKSPPNLLKLRFLQEVFPEATFIVVMRHPIAVALATQKWSLTSRRALIRHWLACHELFLEDSRHIRRLILIRYETFVARPSAIADLQRQVGLDPGEADFGARGGVNAKYFREWKRQTGPPDLIGPLIERRYERRANRFGYCLGTPASTAIPCASVQRLLDTDPAAVLA
jgi:hypothetical protein